MRRIVSEYSRVILADGSGWDLIHLVTTATLVWLGVILLLPGDTFEATPVTFFVHASVAVEEVWGLLLLNVAMVQIVTEMSRKLWIKIAGAMLTSSMFGVWALLLLAGNPWNTGTGTYLLIAYATGMRLWRLVRMKVHE